MTTEQNNDSATKQDNQFIITFTDDETYNYVSLVVRRKGINLADYILDNFEWDDTLPCLYHDAPKKPNSETCDGCNYLESCPDGVKP